MIETVTVKYGYICGTCFHSTDEHSTETCRRIIERVYTEGGLLMMGGSDKPDLRVYCDCEVYDPIRVKVQEQTVRE